MTYNLVECLPKAFLKSSVSSHSLPKLLRGTSPTARVITRCTLKSNGYPALSTPASQG